MVIRFATRWLAVWWLTEFATGFASEWRAVSAGRRMRGHHVGEVRPSVVTVTPSQQAKHVSFETANILVSVPSYSPR